MQGNITPMQTQPQESRPSKCKLSYVIENSISTDWHDWMQAMFFILTPLILKKYTDTFQDQNVWLHQYVLKQKGNQLKHL